MERQKEELPGHGGNMAKRLFSHMDFVEYVKKVLEESDYEFVDYDKDSKYDLIFYDGNKLVIVKVLESYKLKRNGVLENQTRGILVEQAMDLAFNDFKSYLPKPDKQIEIEKILVLTNRQAFNELGEIIEDYEKSGRFQNDVKLMLIPFPIIPNNFAKKKCGNIVFTVSQLIGALKSGVVKLKDIPPPYHDYMITMMKKHGYKIGNEQKEKK